MFCGTGCNNQGSVLKIRICVVIPAYNHGTTLRSVVQAVLGYHSSVIVVDDGSTDETLASLDDLPVHVISLPRNMGKGMAIKLAAEEATNRGFTHIVTLDADWQHQPSDLPAFFNAIQMIPHAIIIGKRDFSVPNIPTSSKFGRKFSEFWMFVQTGTRISDMQSGFRAYPLAVLNAIHCSSNRYAFEIEIIVRSAWAGFQIHEIDIEAYYPPKEERISHFRAIMDNFRISLLNTRLTIRALTPLPFRRSALEKLGLTHPIRTIQELSKDSSPRLLAKSAAWSLLISTMPIIGFNTIMLLFAIGWKKLHRLCALVMIPLTWPPVIPALCVLVGYRMLRGEWLTDFNIQTLGHEAGQRFIDWIIGSLVVAPLLAAVGYAAVFLASKYLVKKD